MFELVILIHCYGIACVDVNIIPFPTMKECAEAAATVKIEPSPKATSVAFCRPVQIEKR